MCQVTVLIDDSVFVQATNSHMADISGSVSITLCGVEAPDSAGVPPLNVLTVLWPLEKCLGVLRRVCLVMWPDHRPARGVTHSCYVSISQQDGAEAQPCHPVC